MEMADGIEVEDLPQFTTRSELMKKVNRIVCLMRWYRVPGPCFDDLYY
jgi:hypothetical protein